MDQTRNESYNILYVDDEKSSLSAFKNLYRRKFNIITASSGEAVAVAFRARDGARSFGGATWGVSTANAAFPLADGSVIFLTVATMADRDGTLYGGKLTPDEPVSGVKTGDRQTDATLDAAVVWLLGQVCT